MLFIHAPLTKSCEPPAALGYLAARLASLGVTATVSDLNLEGILYLLNSPLAASDTWTRRAAKNVGRNLDALHDPQTFTSRDRYHRAATDLNRLVEQHGHHHNLQLSLSNYTDNTLSPLNSSDLLLAAENFSENIFYPLFRERLRQLVEKHAPQRIGFSLSFLSQALTTFAMAGFVRKAFPDIEILMGGGLITTWFGKYPHAATGAVTSHPFQDLVDHLVPGTGDTIFRHLYGAAVDINSPPDFSQLHGSSYLAPGFILPYATSFGCYWRKCSFCPETSEQNSYTQIPPHQVAEDLRLLAGRYQPALIHLLDNGVPPATLKKISEHPPGAPWYGFVRFERLLADRQFCHALRRSGCTMLKLGLESGDQTVLDAMHKGIDLELARTILHNLHEAGIKTYVYLLFGTPAETEESAMKTLSFVERHAATISFLNLAIFNMPVNSLETELLETSAFYSGDLQIYSDFVHPEGWDRGRIRRFLDTSFRKNNAVGQIIRHDPPFFTSNHAPFMR